MDVERFIKRFGHFQTTWASPRVRVHLFLMRKSMVLLLKRFTASSGLQKINCTFVSEVMYARSGIMTSYGTSLLQPFHGCITPVNLRTTSSFPPRIVHHVILWILSRTTNLLVI